MTHEERLTHAGLNIIRELIKELPRKLNRADRENFKKNTNKLAKEQKEILLFEDGKFVKPTEIKEIAEKEMLEQYLSSRLPEGSTNAILGLITFDVGSFIIGITRINPKTSTYNEDFFLLLKEGNDYLNQYIQDLFNRLIEKYASFALPAKPTVGIKQIQEITPETLNRLLNSSEGQFIALTEEQAEQLGIEIGEKGEKGKGLQLDEITARRIRKQSITLDGVNVKLDD